MPSGLCRRPMCNLFDDIYSPQVTAYRFHATLGFPVIYRASRLFDPPLMPLLLLRPLSPASTHSARATTANGGKSAANKYVSRLSLLLIYTRARRTIPLGNASEFARPCVDYASAKGPLRLRVLRAPLGVT